MALVKKAISLFIFAATVCRFISQRRSANPNTQLQKVLAFETKSQESKMNATYLPPLEQQLEGLLLREQDEVIDDFHRIVGTIILLETPLTVPALAELISVSQEAIYNRLDVLHSVLNYPATCETPIRLLHLSFRDFLLDPEKKGNNRFWVNEKHFHGQVAAGCLRILKHSLKEDICNILRPGTDRSEVPLSVIASCIPMQLQYACRYWVNHCRKASQTLISSDEILSFLENHILHFMECLSLLGHLSELHTMIIDLRAIAMEKGHSTLHKLLIDMQRFLRMGLSVIGQYPLQLYSSIRLSVPSTSMLHPILAKNQPAWISKLPNSSKDWDPRRHILDGHRAMIFAMCFSSDNTHMASISKDGNLRIWRFDTGQCVRQIWVQKPDHPTSNGILTFINLVWIVTYFGDSLYVWHIDTAKLVRTHKIVISDTLMTSPCVSPCGRYYAFVEPSYGCLIVLYLDPTDHRRQAQLDMSKLGFRYSHGQHVYLWFSPDSKRITIHPTCNPDQLFFWDIRSNTCTEKFHNKMSREIFDNDLCRARSVGLCNDRLIVAHVLKREPREIQIRWLDSWGLIHTLKGHEGHIITVNFLNDCKTVGSSCHRGEVRTWNIANGECLTCFSPFPNPLDVEGARKIVLSSDYQMASTLFGTQTLSITTTVPNRESTTAATNEDRVAGLICSNDASHAASFSKSGIIRFWDFATGNSISRADGESYRWYGKVDLPWLTKDFEYMVVPIEESATSSRSYGSRKLEVWRRKTGQLIGCFTTRTASRDSSLARSMLPKGHDIDISPNGRYIALVQKDALRIHQIDIDTSRPIECPGHIWDIMFSPDSSLLIIASSESTGLGTKSLQDYTETVSIYNLERGEIARISKSSRMAVRIVDISMDSGLLALHMAGISNRCQDRLEIIDVKTKRTVLLVFEFQNAVDKVIVDRELQRCACEKGYGFGCVNVIANFWTGAIAELQLHYGRARVNFDTDPNLLSTNRGYIRADKLEGSITNLDVCDRVGLGLSQGADWILWNNTKLFWLPPAFRPDILPSRDLCVEVSGSTVMIGASTGVSFFIFNIGDLLNCSPPFTTSPGGTACSSGEST